MPSARLPSSRFLGCSPTVSPVSGRSSVQAARIRFAIGVRFQKLWPVLKRRSVAGFKAPNDSTALQTAAARCHQVANGCTKVGAQLDADAISKRTKRAIAVAKARGIKHAARFAGLSVDSSSDDGAPITARHQLLDKLAADQPCRGADRLQLELCRQISGSECCQAGSSDIPPRGRYRLER